jgi:hypothetical protein
MANRLNTWRALAIVLWLIGSISIGAYDQARAQKSAEEIRINPQSKEGALLLKVDTIGADHQLFFQRSGESGFGSRVYIMKVDPGPNSEVYIARTLKPGRYRLTSIWQQGRWGLVFPRDTIEFEITGGSVSYLGKLDTLTLLKAVQASAVAAGKTVSAAPGSGYSTDKHGLRPKLSQRDAIGLAQARSFAMQAMRIPDDMVQLGQVYTDILK